MAFYIDRIEEFDNLLAGIDQESLKSCKDVIFI